MRVLNSAAACAAILAVAAIAPLAAQTAPAGEVIGVGNFLHVVSDAEKSIAFYHDVIGMDVQRPPNAPSNPGPRPYLDTPEIVSLYNATGARYRTATGMIAESPMRAELVEWNGIERHPVHLRFQDPGAGNMILSVRDLDSVVARVKESLQSTGAKIVTTGGNPVTIPLPDGHGSLRVILVQDPDGFFVELVQPSTLPAAAGSNNIYKVGFGVTVYDTDRMMRVFHDALGFEPTTGAWLSDPVVAGALGVPGGVFRRTTALVPGTSLEVEFLEFKGADRQHYASTPRDPGTSMLRLLVRDIDSAVKRLDQAGAKVISKDGIPVTFSPNNTTQRFAIVQAPDNFLIQLVQRVTPPAPPAPSAAR